MRTALLVPCFNALRFLPRLQAQVDRLRPAFDEVLLADDASTDETANLAESLGFKILRLPKNLGPGGARNALARASTADWLHFHDVDDELSPEYLTQVLPFARPETDVVLHFVDFIDEASRTPVIRWDFVPAALLADPAEYLLRHPLPTSATFLRRSRFLELGGFDEIHRCFEDGDFNFRMAAAGARLACVPLTLEYSLRHSGGASANQRYCFECRLDYLESYAERQPARFHAAIAAESERAATMLLRLGDKPSARRAVALCQRLGYPVPATAHPVLRALRPIFPALTLLGWQDRWRQQRQSPGPSHLA
jgi:glycosyltransferase involved in cell wall biosynthesis